MATAPLWLRDLGEIDEISRITHRLLEVLEVEVTATSVALVVRAHPAYPSLAAVVDALAEFGVKGSARRTDLDGLVATPKPALVQLQRGDGSVGFAIVTAIDDGRATLLDPRLGPRTVPLTELGQELTGIVLRPVVEAGAGEPGFARQRRVERLFALRPALSWALPLTALAATTLATLRAADRIGALGLLGLAWVGLLLSLALSLHGVGAKESLLGRMCPTGKRFNCSVVLGSPGSRLLGVIPLADLGVVFFLAEVGAIATGAAIDAWPGVAALLLAISVALVPLSLAPIGYQALVLRRFCPLCLGVMAIVWAEALWLGWRSLGVAAPETLSSHFLVALDPSTLALLAAGAATSTLAWAIVRPLIEPALAAPTLATELDRMKSYPELIERELSRSPPVSVEGGIVSGPAGAPLELVLISHPFCSACADAHRRAHRYAEELRGVLRIRTLFCVDPAEANARAAARVLLTATDQDALDAWFGDMDRRVAEFVKRPGAADLAREAEPELDRQRELALALGIVGTPFVLVAGRRLPPELGLRHLRGYLRALAKRVPPPAAT